MSLHDERAMFMTNSKDVGMWEGSFLAIFRGIDM